MTEAPRKPGDQVFRLQPDIVMEVFEGEGALLLRLNDRRLFELNETARHLLELTDGQRSVAQVASDLAQAFQAPETEVLADTLALYAQLGEQQLVEAVDPAQEGEKDAMEEIQMSARYMTNPDVVLREEDEDGALLFNPDTNQVQVLNTTGLFIWKQCDGRRDLTEITSALQQAFEEVPTDQVAQDVQEFVEGMVATGFIGTVESLDSGD